MSRQPLLHIASVLDSAIVGYFLLLHAIVALPRENANPDVDCDRNRLASMYSATTEQSVMQTKKTENAQRKRGHRMLTWKTQQSWEKPRQPTDCRKSLWEEYNNGENTEATTSCTPSSPHGGYSGGSDLSLSLTLTLSLSLYTVALYTHTTTFNNSKSVQLHMTVFALSHIYTHMTFRAIYTYGPKGLT